MRAILCAVVVLIVAGPVAAQDMALSTILIEGEGWKPVAKGFKSVNGLAVDKEGSLYVADGMGKRIARIKEGLAVTVVETSAEPVGLSFTPDGALLVCLPGKGEVVEVDVAKGAVHGVKAELKAVGVAVNHKGTAYYTVPSEHAIYAQDKDGKPRKVAEGIAEPTGLTFSPDGGTLAVADAAGKHIYAYRVNKEGSLDAMAGYFTMRLPNGEKASGAGEMTIDPVGRYYVATTVGLHSYDPTGRLNGVMLNPIRAVPAAVALGGADGETLYLGLGEQVFGRKIHAKPALKK
jgi:sugar lactone lactonase YvrE